jgi:S1-C subfamily serine protease
MERTESQEENKMNRPISEGGQSLLALSNDLAAAVERAGRSLVSVYARERIPSSGIHWREGVVVTAAHTVRREEEIMLKLPAGQKIAATLAGVDPGTDLAALKIEKAEVPVAELGDSSALKPGHFVLSVGRSAERGPKASLGIISSVGGLWRTWRGGEVDQFVQADLPRYPGFSGSALVDAHGLILGLNTSGLSRRLSITLPNSTIERIIGVLLEKGRVPRGFLGLGMHAIRLPGALRHRLNLGGETGVIILQVEPNGPADQAGTLIGDILVGLEGKIIQNPDDVQAALTSGSVGKTVSASVIRGGVMTELAITIGERPRRS